ncbi:MAG: TrmB family transcriptional regulator [Candidatus Thorarchaeota archaeon]|jgi:sugar-specific transcriptional regulator TrmB
MVRDSELQTNTLRDELMSALELTQNEARLFLVLLNGESFTASQLSSLTRINRTRVYDTVKGLMNKDLIEEVSTDPLIVSARQPNGIVRDRLEALRSNYEGKIQAVMTLGRTLEEYSSRGFVQGDTKNTSLVELDEGLTIMRSLLAMARERVWVCKRTTGGIFDWFKLKSELHRLAERGIDIRFLSDHKMKIGFDVRDHTDIPLSFALVDSYGISFVNLDSSDIGPYAFVTKDVEYVKFHAKLFLDLWESE